MDRATLSNRETCHAEFTRSAAVVPESIDRENRIFQIIWTTGAPVLRTDDYGEEFWEELSLDSAAVDMGRMQSGQARFLDAHNSYSNDAVLGRIFDPQLTPDRGTASVRYVKNDTIADRHWNKIEQGILGAVSVGYRIYEFERIEGGPGGRPIIRATKWEPYEVSLCPIGADAGAEIRSAVRSPRTHSIVITRAPALEGRAMSVAATQTRAATDEDASPKKAGDPVDNPKGDNEEARKREAEERAKQRKREREDEDEKLRRKREDEDEKLRRKREDEDAEDSYRADGDDDEDDMPAGSSGRSTGEDDDEETPGEQGNRSSTHPTTRTELIASGEERERKRVQRIYRAVAKAHMPEAAKAALAQRLIEDKTPMGKIAERVLSADAEHSDRGPSDHGLGGRGGISAGLDATEKFTDGATQWLLSRCGAAAVDAVRRTQKLAASDEVMHGFGETERAFMAQPISFNPGEFRGLTLMELGRRWFELRGNRSLQRMDKMRQAELMLHRDFGGSFFARDVGGVNTTSDFPFLLENVLHKLLLAMYAITPDTWRPFCMVGSVVDFRAHPRYRLANLTVLSALNEHGEFVNQSIPDAEKQSVTATTVGTIIGISRQSLVNDDMGAFSMLAQQLGRACKLTPEVLFYNTLALNGGLGPNLSDGNPMFNSSRSVTIAGTTFPQSNIGTASQVGVTAFDADAIQMALMRDPSGNELLDLSPDRILVPRSLKGQVDVINKSQYDTDGTTAYSGGVTTDAKFIGNPFMVPNRVNGMFSGGVVGTARLSGTRRYMFADPMIAPCFEMAFLDGQQAPQLDWRPGFRTDGLEWRARLDLGLAGIDFRGCLTNAGL